MTLDPTPLTIAGLPVPTLTTQTVIVGTGSAGLCAADRLWELGHDDILIVTDKVRAGTSRNAGSDKQTYYKLTLSGSAPDSVRDMATTLFNGGAMDGDNALAEAALSTRAFMRLVDLGVPFPSNSSGEFVGYKTDHDPRQRATSAGPYTSRSMVTQLEAKVRRNGTRVIPNCRVLDLIVDEGTVAGVLLLRTDEAPATTDRPSTSGDENSTASPSAPRSPFLAIRATTVVLATGGPAGIYSRSVFPHGQWGATGAGLRAGARGKNLTEWQFGLSSLHPRWNVSGTYMQAIPRFVSTDAAGGDEREFLSEVMGDDGHLLSMTFLKGYQWPFDIRKARDGSSVIDLLVYRETVLRGRRVWLDFRRNPVRERFDPSALTDEAREYLERTGALRDTPIERLRAMNEPAYQLYLEKNPSIDLAHEMLEVDVCAQHNNGGLLVDSWWQSNVRGLFPIGETAGSHGVYRPGGAALNSAQVGATRAAQYISARRTEEPLSEKRFAAAAAAVTAAARDLIDAATSRFRTGLADNTAELLGDAQQMMSDRAGLVRSPEGLRSALAEVAEKLGTYGSLVVASPDSRRSIDRTFLIRDILTTQYVYLSAMVDYLEHGGHSRGSVLYTDPQGSRPLAVWDAGDPAHEVTDLPETFRFRTDDGQLDGEAQEVSYQPPSSGVGGPGTVSTHWRPVRPIPPEDEVFETVWKTFRQTGGVS